ncbi:MAG: bifunctional nuclease family protein [candidate division WOR-3 bacterium]
MIEVKVDAVLFNNSANAPVMLLREVGGKRVLPVSIGIAEASTISYALQGVQYVRPLTVDLMRNIIHGLNGSLSRVIITKLEDNTFYAELIIETREGILALDARPSDSVGLALRMGAPIFVEDDVMDNAGQWLSDEDEVHLEELRTKLRHINPEDFGSSQV